MCKLFTERGYPSSIVTSALERVRNIDLEKALKPTKPKIEERIPLIHTSVPFEQSSSHKYHFEELLQTDSETLKTHPFLNNHLSLWSNMTKVYVISLPSDLQLGTFRCSRKRCNTCPFVKNTTSIPGSKRPFRLHLYQRYLPFVTSFILEKQGAG